MLRVPALPMDEWRALSEATSLEQLDSLLSALSARPEIASALHLASPVLTDAIEGDNSSAAPAKDHARLRITLLKYMSRMTTRCTPFGVFTQVGVGSVGQTTDLRVGRLNESRWYARLDAERVRAWFQRIFTMHMRSEGIRYFPNQTLCRTGSYYRYYVPRSAYGRKGFDSRETPSTPHLDAVLTSAREGAAFSALVDALVAPDLAREEIDDFLMELIQAEVLVHDCAPSTSGAPPLTQLRTRLTQLEADAATLDVVSLVEEALRGINPFDAQGFRDKVSSIRTATDPLLPTTEKVSVLHIDTFSAAHPTLADSDAHLIGATVDLVCRMYVPRADTLRTFARRFTERYDRRAVPLLEALDTETGVGFPARVDDAADSAAEAEARDRDATLLRLYDRVRRVAGRTLHLQEGDIAALVRAEPLATPDACAALVTLLGTSSGGSSADPLAPRIHFKGISGPSGASLLGRFSHGSPELRTHIESHLRAEESFAPAAVFAEIVHDVHDRAGNVLDRPLLRQFELEVYGYSGAAPENRISLDDLCIVVRDGVPLIFSKRLGKQVIPRLANAHQFDRDEALPAYRFLATLQRAGLAKGGTWSWGALSALTFTPRVQYGTVVLAPARWRLSLEEVEPKLVGSSDLSSSLAAWLRAQEVPRHVVLHSSSEGLSIDLGTSWGLDLLASELRRHRSVLLDESLLDAYGSRAHGNCCQFANEVVLPLLREPSSATRTHVTVAFPPPRQVALEAGWIYLKLYAGQGRIDRFVSSELNELVEHLETRQLIGSWFFVRYRDPEWHVRLRFRPLAADLRTSLLDSLYEFAAMMVGTCEFVRFQFDTYEPEVERYGGTFTLDTCERHFHRDSNAAMRTVSELRSVDLGDERMRTAVASSHLLLTAVIPEVGRRSALLRNRPKGSAGAAKEVRGFTGMFLRTHRTLFDLLASDPSDDALLAELPHFEHYVGRHRIDVSDFSIFRELAGPVTREDIALTLIHMSLNRLLAGEHLEKEPIVLDVLERLVASEAARMSHPMRADYAR